MKSNKSSKLPTQAVPVERQASGAAISNPNQQGVEASIDWGKIASTVGGVLGNLI